MQSMTKRPLGGRAAAALLVAVTLSLAACARPATQPVAVAAALPTASPIMTAPPVTASPSARPAASAALPSPKAAATMTPPLAIPVALQGQWIAKVAGTSASSGLWKMRITKDDVLLHNPVATDPNGYFSMGPSGFDATTLTLYADSGCPDQATVTDGHYTWKLVGGTLTFIVVNDSCTDRSGVLTASSWVKAP